MAESLLCRCDSPNELCLQFLRDRNACELLILEALKVSINRGKRRQNMLFTCSLITARQKDISFIQLK